MEDFGFVMTRYVNSKITNEYWKECYKCIRKFYDNEILIVDDYSDSNFLDDMELKNCTIIQSEHPRRGEILGYYYYYKMKPKFTKAIFLHDSVFIKKKYNFENYGEEILFLWSFRHDYDLDYWIKNIIFKLKNHEEIIKLYDRKDSWFGCFGVMSMISWHDLHQINERYDFFQIILENVLQREDRSSLERIFACVCYLTNNMSHPPSLLGDIHDYCRQGITYQDYLEGKTTRLPIVKVCTGR